MPKRRSRNSPRPHPAGTEAERQAQLARLSHDLRQPLQALQINAAAMALRARRIGDEALLRLADAVDSSLQHSQRLLDGLLALSCHLPGNLPGDLPGALAPRLQWLDPWPVLCSLQQEHAEPARQRGQRLELGEAPKPPLQAVSDPNLLRRLLANLLVNALKFSPQGVVQLLAGPAVGGRLRLQVVDSGIGMTDQQQARAFEPFYQAAPGQGSASGQGLGLGLAIAKELAQALNIGLALHSQPGQGCCVTLWLPMAMPVPPPA